MNWEWIQDTPEQGRAVCRQTGLALLVIATGGTPYMHWRLRGWAFDPLHEISLN